MSDSLWSHAPQPTRLLCPQDSPGKSTGAGCHFLLQGSSWPRDQTLISCIAGRFFTNWPTREAQRLWKDTLRWSWSLLSPGKNFLTLPGVSVVKNLPQAQEMKVQSLDQSLGWEDPWRRKWQPTPVFLPGESHGQREPGDSPWGWKRVRHD